MEAHPITGEKRAGVKSSPYVKEAKAIGQRWIPISTNGLVTFHAPIPKEKALINFKLKRVWVSLKSVLELRVPLTVTLMNFRS